MSDVLIGGHDKGFWDIENSVKAKSQAFEKNLDIDQAVTKASARPGAELVVVNKDGSANLHEVTMKKNDWFYKDKKIQVGEIDRKNEKGYWGSNTVPLAIDKNIAGKFGGETAFLIDESNKLTYIGSDVSLPDSEKINDAIRLIINNPNKKTAAAAYAIGDEIGAVKKIEVGVGNHALDIVEKDYKNTAPAKLPISVLREGTVKTSVNGLLVKLDNIEGDRSNTIQSLRTQLNNRTEQYKNDIAAPNQRLNKANNDWNNAKQQEDSKVGVASENLRVVKYPGIREAESDLSKAQHVTSNAKGNLENATGRRIDAENNLQKIENLVGEVKSLQNKNEQLENENNNLPIKLAAYLTTTVTSLNSQISHLDQQKGRYQIDLEREMSKPDRPAGGGGGSVHDDPFGNKPGNGGGSVTDNPFDKNVSSSDADAIAKKVSGGDGWVSKDDLKNNGYDVTESVREKIAGDDHRVTEKEFADALRKGDVSAKGMSSSGHKGSVTDNPFNNGSGNKSGSVHDDPFSNGSGGGVSYRNDNIINQLDRQIKEINRDRTALVNRLNPIAELAKRMPYTGMNVSAYDVARLHPEDGIQVKYYTDKYKNNNSEINSNNSAINQKTNYYRNNISGAKNSVSQAVSAESSAKANYELAVQKESHASSNLAAIKNNPRPDSHPEVKPVAQKYEAALKNRADRVGENAPLTKERASARQVVDQINSQYQGDKSKLDNKMHEVQAGAAVMANSMISGVRVNLKTAQ